MKRFAALCLCVLAFFSLCACRQVQREEETKGYGLFSWKDTAVTQPQALWEIAGRAGVTQIYQAFSGKLTQEEMGAFVSGAQSKGTGVYYLDVEPYLTDDWHENQEEAMRHYVSAMEHGYAEAKKQRLPLILCVPYFYDTKGQSELLARLIANACDAIAIMNYQKKDEAGQIAFAAETAAKHGKSVIHIYELQAPGKHDLTERNTYYTDGLEAVEVSRERLLGRFPEVSLSFALHDYEALKDLVRNE